MIWKEISIRITPEEKVALKALAELEGRSVENYLRNLIENELKKQGMA